MRIVGHTIKIDNVTIPSLWRHAIAARLLALHQEWLRRRVTRNVHRQALRHGGYTSYTLQVTVNITLRRDVADDGMFGIEQALPLPAFATPADWFVIGLRHTLWRAAGDGLPLSYMMVVATASVGYIDV